MSILYKITFNACFPEGLSIGDKNKANKKIIARNGVGEYVLRGTALAGALRSTYAEMRGEHVFEWFGEANHDEIDVPSKIKISDSIINSNALYEQHHNAINRHTGATYKGALFSLEVLAPGCHCLISITLETDEHNLSECEGFLSDIVIILNSHLKMGGNSNRGIGRLVIEGAVHVEKYDLETLDGTVKWLNEQYIERQQGVTLCGQPMSGQPNRTSQLHIKMKLGIPRGEDFLIASGQEVDAVLKPQKITFNDSSEYWKIPGSSLRGIIRSWITRLAARDGYQVTDSYDNWSDNLEDINADDVAYGFANLDQRGRYKNNPALLKDPILNLFGSMYKKGRIHISDAFSSQKVNDDAVHERMHVAVDRFSGGANEGALFSNQVLVNSSLTFSVHITLDKPTEEECQWLTKTLRALHLGILLVGSSKSSGRLEIKTLSASGQHEKIISQLQTELST